MNLSPIKLFNYIKPALATKSKSLQSGALCYYDPMAKDVFGSMIISHTGARYVKTNRSAMSAIKEKVYPFWFFKSSDLEGKEVLDVGTGGGQLVLDLRKKGANAIGIDIFPYPEHAQNPELFQIADATDTKFPDKSFDRIYSAMSIFSFRDDNFEFKLKTLNEMKRILKNDGRIRLGGLLSDFKKLFQQTDGLKITAEDMSYSNPRWVELAKSK